MNIDDVFKILFGVAFVVGWIALVVSAFKSDLDKIKRKGIKYPKESVPKPLIEVACICPSKRVFDNWVRDNAVEGEKYIWVYSIDKIRGRRFSRVEKLYKYYEVRGINEILQSRVISRLL